MTERERLIELLGLYLPINVPNGMGSYMTIGERTLGRDDREKLADHILSDGWTRLPCKVGDTVYFSAEGYHDSAEIDGIHIDENGIVFSWVQYEVGVDITEVWDDGEFDIDEIGKTVFLTPEEAEKHLQKERSKNEKS